MNAFCRRGLGLFIAGAILIAGVATVSAQQVFSPPRGSPERAAILDAVRPAAEVVLHPPVEFVVTKMNVVDGWAFVALNPQRPGGGAIDPRQTRLARNYEAGVVDGLTTYALLLFRNGRWHLIDWAIGPTDLFWDSWPDRFGVPRAIFR
jgi:hypothetical protein